MEFRTLRYFLAVADAENLSKAAETVHTTQPNLTRQIKALEEELGQELFIRSRGMQLTPAGELLRKRAEQICDLYELADEEIRFFGKGKRIAGTIRIAAGESSSITSVARAVARLQKEHPLIKIDIKSCDTREVVESLHRGLCDFGILVEPAPIGEFTCLRLPSYDRWGILCLRGSRLSFLEKVRPDDLRGERIIHSRHTGYTAIIENWLGRKTKFDAVATYNLMYNASLLVKEGVGVAFGLDGIVASGDGTPFAFVPLDPPIHSQLDLVYRKGLPLSEPSEAFLRSCEEEFAPGKDYSLPS